MDKNNSAIKFEEFTHKEIEESKVNGKFKIPSILGAAAGHLPLPSGIGVASESTAKFNKVAVAVDAIRTCVTLIKERNNKTSQNTGENSIVLTSAWKGAYGGAVTGVAIGTAICPAVGTIVGGIVGGIAGGITSSLGSVITTRLNELNYQIIESKCSNCGKQFKERIHNGERNVYKCRECRQILQQLQ